MNPTKGVAIFTAIEVVTMVAWLFFASRANVVGVVLLTAGLFVEHVVSYNVGTGQSWFQFPLRPKA